MRRVAKVLLAGLIFAGSTLIMQGARAEQAGITSPQSAVTADIPSLGQTIPASELEQQSGGKDLTLTVGDVDILNNNLEQNVNAGGNLITGATNTGSNYVSDNAFQNAAGIANLIQNTGNQVIIQNSMNMNLLAK
jgi:hypothetical protein